MKKKTRHHEAQGASPGSPPAGSRTSCTTRPRASRSSRSTGPRCATPSGPTTLNELARAFKDAHEDPEIGVIVLTGAGDLAFCSGGDQRIRGDKGYVGLDGVPRLNVLDLQKQIRSCPKPVVAMVAGYAIGGGHVLHVVCDLTIAADNARFGQTGPRVGSFDGGFGASILADLVGPKKAKEIWFTCRQYDAKQALEMGLVNAVVPLADLEKETVAMCREILQHSPLALRCLKSAFNAPLRRRGRHPGARGQRDAALLHERGGAGRPQRLRREAPPRLRQVQARALTGASARAPTCATSSSPTTSPSASPSRRARARGRERRGAWLRLEDDDGRVGWARRRRSRASNPPRRSRRRSKADRSATRPSTSPRWTSRRSGSGGRSPGCSRDAPRSQVAVNALVLAAGAEAASGRGGPRGGGGIPHAEAQGGRRGAG